MKPFAKTMDALLARPFLTEPDWEKFTRRCEIIHQQMESGQSLLCAESESVDVLAVVFAGLLKNCGVFLANLHWGKAEWEQVQVVSGFHHVFGRCPIQPDASRARNFTSPRIMIPSGGTSGKLKFCVHSPDTLAASVQSLFRFHHEKPLSSINPLPVFHVSGWMPIMRACLTGGTVRLATWKDLEQGDYPRTVGNHCSLSLVPTQLARLVRTEAGLRFLHGFDSIYIGGAAPSPVLVNTIRTEKLPALFVYGSTETASMVIAGTRADSDSSGSLWASPLPGVEAELSDEQELIVRSPSLFRGYFPEDSPVEAWPTGDIARRLSDGNLQVIGRKDYLINTGGEKVNPEEVEAALSDCLPGSDFAVGSESDLEWGQRVVALVGRNLSPEEMKSLFEKLSEKLAPYKIPKRILPVEHIPRTLSGKINRAEVRHLLSSPGS